MTSVVLHRLDNATPEQVAFGTEAVAVLTEVVNNPEFAERVRAERYSSTWRTADEGGYTRTSNEDVVGIITTGKEFRVPANDRIDLTVTLERLRPGTLGVVRPPNPLITTNTLFFDDWMGRGDSLSLAAHWMHEWMHVAGFYHPRRRATRDVSYRVGDIVIAVGRPLQGVEKAGVASAAAFDAGFGYLKATHDESCPVFIPGAPDDEADGQDVSKAFLDASAAPDAAPPGAFVVDVHAHTFNASDLSVAGFLANVLVESDEHQILRLLDPLVRMLARVVGRAPGAEAEIRRLDKIEAARRGRVASAFLDADAEDTITRSAEMQASVASEVARLQSSMDAGEQELFAALAQETAEEGGASELMLAAADADGIGRIVRGIFSAPGTIGRYVRWVGRLKSYRHELISELVRTYGEERGNVQLFTPSMVDFARWVRDEPVTPPDVQVVLGGRLSRAFPGRVHFMAAFDPWREADHPDATSGSLYWAKRGVEDYGFVGVKLYPPMGFSAIGNASHDFSEVTSEPRKQFGRRLDDALERLFAWAEQEEVPLLAHCNESNGNKQHYAKRASPEYWRQALKKHPGLRLNLGHFGGQEKLGIPGEWPEQIIALMNEFPHVYADIGMFHLGGARDRDEWFDRLMTAMKRSPVLESRLLYGSDWIMLAKEKGAPDFYRNFEHELRVRFSPPVAEAVLGGNAVQYLGLGGGSKATQRLRRFYQAHGLPTPAWL